MLPHAVIEARIHLRVAELRVLAARTALYADEFFRDPKVRAWQAMRSRNCALVGVSFLADRGALFDPGVPT